MADLPRFDRISRSVALPLSAPYIMQALTRSCAELLQCGSLPSTVTIASASRIASSTKFSLVQSSERSGL